MQPISRSRKGIMKTPKPLEIYRNFLMDVSITEKPECQLIEGSSVTFVHISERDCFMAVQSR